MWLASPESGCWMINHLVTRGGQCAQTYPPGFRRKVLDLVAAGRAVAQVAGDLGMSAQVIYTWRRQQLIDSGQMPGITSSDQAELVAARKRIAELETELAIHRRATELPGLVATEGRFEAVAVMAAESLPAQRRQSASWMSLSPATTSGGAARRQPGRCGTRG
jgi:transposase-like protein